MKVEHNIMPISGVAICYNNKQYNGSAIFLPVVCRKNFAGVK